MKTLIFILPIILFVSGCGSMEPPVDIETYDRVNQFFGISYVEVKVTSVTEKVEILDIVVNRGNCKIEDFTKALGYGSSLPRKLSFGQSIEMSFGGPCSAKQVDIVTDLGEWTWTY